MIEKQSKPRKKNIHFPVEGKRQEERAKEKHNNKET